MRPVVFATRVLLGAVTGAAVLTQLVIHTHSDEATQALGESLAADLQPGDVLLLSGDLGAGKTRLAKGIARGLDVGEPITSPTFNILLVHEGRIPLYHFDLYRLEDAAQLEDLDYFGTLEADGVSVVEWGDRFDEAKPGDGLSIVIRIEGDDDRVLTVSSIGERGEELVSLLRAACEERGMSCEAGESE